MTDLRLQHVFRSVPPWRRQSLTECGLILDDGQDCITREEVEARIRQLGKQRTAFTVCMTCYNRMSVVAVWSSDPVGVIRRDCERAGLGASKKSELLKRELRAIAALIETNRDQFDGYLEGLDSTADLAARRVSRRRNRAAGGR